MPDRLVREGLLASRKWTGLKLHLQNFFVRLILAADDYGTFPADPALIRSRCYPLEGGRAREADLQRWLEELEQAGLVRFHWHTESRYLTLEKFGQAERMKAPRARYPRATPGEAPDASGQAFMPFEEPGQPPRPKRPPRFSAHAEEKRREEKSPHSPPPAGGATSNTPDPAGRKPRRFRTPERRAARATEISKEIDRIREEMRDIYYPGGCATKVTPTAEKAARADALRARWDALETERDALTDTPEITGGAEP